MARLTLTIDGDAREGMGFLREHTDAQDDADVIRNALRLHHALLQAHMNGTVILTRKKGTTALEHVNIFASGQPHLTVVK